MAGFRWCPVTWPSDSRDAGEKPHRCQSANWHLGAHRCPCGATLPGGRRPLMAEPDYNEETTR